MLGALLYSPRLIIWERVGIDVDVVGRWCFQELDCGDGAVAFDPGFADAVHAIHDATVCAKDDGISEVGFFYQLRVQGDVSGGGVWLVGLEPIGFLVIEDGVDLHFLDGKRSGELHEAMDIPEVKAFGGLALVVLASHSDAGRVAELGRRINLKPMRKIIRLMAANATVIKLHENS